jgi:hypothetical protein
MKKYYLLEVYKDWECSQPSGPPFESFFLNEYNTIKELTDAYKKGPRREDGKLFALESIDID